MIIKGKSILFPNAIAVTIEIKKEAIGVVRGVSFFSLSSSVIISVSQKVYNQ
jgi:hypothetical protein